MDLVVVAVELVVVVVVMLYLFPMSAALIPDDFEVFGGSVAFNRPRLQILHPENGAVLETSDLDIIVKVLLTLCWFGTFL